MEVLDGPVQDRLPGRQGRVLFGYLAAHRREHARDELVEALWPGRAPAKADSALSALLSGLRRALGDQALEGRSLVRLRLPGDAWIDLEAAGEAIHRAESAAAHEEWDRVWGPSLVALFVARRRFLPEADAPWADEWRRRLEAIRLSALECYTACAIELGGGEIAIAQRTARELIAGAPFYERGHLLLMRALAAGGNAAEALRVYEDMRRLLRDELGAVPGPELRRLQASLLREGAVGGAES